MYNQGWKMKNENETMKSKKEKWKIKQRNHEKWTLKT